MKRNSRTFSGLTALACAAAFFVSIPGQAQTAVSSEQPALVGSLASNVSATNQWTWMGGSSTLPSAGSGLPGVYGTLGVPAAGNIPGSRDIAATWTGGGGHLWLFGGQGYDVNGNQGNLNDLWEFNPSTNQWGWMGGSTTVPVTGNGSGANPGVYGKLGLPAAGNLPGGRLGASTWADSSGRLWLFGGQGSDANGTPGLLNDLWAFNPSTNQWAWMGGGSTVPISLIIIAGGNPGVYGKLGVPGAGNTPGGRWGASSWTDSSGHFWLFGGWGYDANLNWGFLSDLWEFDPSTNAWTWMGGSSTDPGNGNGNSGVYGTLGVPAAGNIPGGRASVNTWTDSSGHLWLFGGTGYDAIGNRGDLNDLWEFSPSTNQWAWMGGSSTIPGAAAGNAGVYGTLGVPAAENIPGSRDAGDTWTDRSGHLWLFGGYGWGADFSLGQLNDLWVFDPSTNQWAWMGGSSTVSGRGSPGVYGTLGSPSAGNVPGGRVFASSWSDGSGNLWLFWGFGIDANGNQVYLNDRWRYQPLAPVCVSTAAVGSWTNAPFPAQTGTFTATFDATPSAAPTNEVIGLSHGPQTDIGDFAVLVSFSSSGHFVARNGGSYAATKTIPYSAGVSYHFRLVVNVATKRYSVYVTAPGGKEQTVATNFAFRDGVSVTSLNSVGSDVDTTTGEFTYCSFMVQ